MSTEREVREKSRQGEKGCISLSSDIARKEVLGIEVSEHSPLDLTTPTRTVTGLPTKTTQKHELRIPQTTHPLLGPNARGSGLSLSPISALRGV